MLSACPPSGERPKPGEPMSATCKPQQEAVVGGVIGSYWLLGKVQ